MDGYGENPVRLKIDPNKSGRKVKGQFSLIKETALSLGLAIHCHSVGVDGVPYIIPRKKTVGLGILDIKP